uniref:Uncharacterized protein n=1 Tax=Entomoneis paludosa TaxID=265537 RepID=A0A7S2YNE5_9STRA|mmetsp:Transcript_40296/g.83901  ORF Transcript_40296/g.83901 Transcript_40296/m.83901 type:complete len:196 (+) Transcript_40296:203-790(+)
MKTDTTEVMRSRGVSFDESQNLYHEVPMEDSSHKEEHSGRSRWYKRDDFDRMKEQTRRTNKRLRKALDDGDQHLEESTNDLYVSALEQAYDACCCMGTWPSTREQEELKKLLQQCPPRVTGLERKLVKAAVMDKRFRRVQLLYTANCLHYDYPTLDQDELAELLREKCQEISRPSVLFAQHMGWARAHRDSVQTR